MLHVIVNILKIGVKIVVQVDAVENLTQARRGCKLASLLPACMCCDLCTVTGLWFVRRLYKCLGHCKQPGTRANKHTVLLADSWQEYAFYLM